MQEDIARLRQTVLAQAEEIRAHLIEEIHAEEADKIDSFRAKRERKEEVFTQNEKNKVRAAVNEKLSALRMREHRALLLRREELLEELFSGVEEKLRAYVTEKDYQIRMAQYLKAAVNRYRGEDMLVEVCRKEDVGLAKECVSEAVLSEEDFIGGFRLVLPERHMVINQTLMGRMEEEKNAFHEIRIESEVEGK